MQVINYSGVPARPASDLIPARAAIPGGSFRLYESEAEAASVAARGSVGITELNEAKAGIRAFIVASDEKTATAKSATNEQGETADQIAATQGITSKERNIPGEIGAWLGRTFVDPVARIGNVGVSTSKSTHDWNSVNPDDILTGGGKDNNRYPVLVQAAARSLAFINKALNNQTNINVQTNQENAEKATNIRLNNEQYDREVIQPGTAAYYYARLMSIFQPPVEEHAVDVETALAELEALDQTTRETKQQEIKAIGKQVMEDGRPRYKHDMSQR